MNVTFAFPSIVKTKPAAARYDHFEAKCAYMVERDRSVVVGVAWEEASDLRKERDGAFRNAVLKDVLAFCDENVARCEPGVRGLRWSDSHVFFHARTIPKRNHPQHGLIPHAVDHSEILAAPWGRVHIKRRNGHTRGFGESGKENCSGGGRHREHREHDVVAIASGVTDRENGTVASRHGAPLGDPRKCAGDGARGVLDQDGKCLPDR